MDWRSWYFGRLASSLMRVTSTGAMSKFPLFTDFFSGAGVPRTEFPGKSSAIKVRSGTSPSPYGHGLKAFGISGQAISPFNSFPADSGAGRGGGGGGGDLVAACGTSHRKCAQTGQIWLQSNSHVAWSAMPVWKTTPIHATAKKYVEHGRFGAVLTFGVKGGMTQR